MSVGHFGCDSSVEPRMNRQTADVYPRFAEFEIIHGFRPDMDPDQPCRSLRYWRHLLGQAEQKWGRKSDLQATKQFIWSFMRFKLWSGAKSTYIYLWVSHIIDLD
jgi:hypothetical protein